MLRTLLGGATALVAAASLSLVGIASPAAATGTNPLAPTLGFTVLTEGGGSVTGGSETQGSWAVGGDFTLDSGYVLGTPMAQQSIPSIGGTTTQLLTGGSVVFHVGNEALDLNAGALRVGDTQGYTVTEGKRFSTIADPGSYARMNADEPITTVTSSQYASSFSSAFTSLRANSASIHALDASNATMLTLIDGTDFNGISGSDKGLQLVSGTVNVLRVTAAQIANVANIKLLGAVSPSATTPLYIDVTDAGTVDTQLPTIMSGNGNSVTAEAAASYSLFNFASATSVTVQNGDRIEGAILAPSAAVALTHGTYEGQIVAKSFAVSSSQEIHGYVFGGSLPPTTPTPKVASASISTTPASCSTPEKLVLGDVANAGWGTATGATGPGTYSVVATADSGAQFADGSTTKTFSGTLAGPATGDCQVLDADKLTPSASANTTCGVTGSISWIDDAQKVTYALTSGDGHTGHNEVTATAVEPWTFADGSTTHVYSFELGAYTDCVKPAVTVAVGACTANGDGPSTETATFTFDNSGSTRAVVFAIPSAGISQSVAAGTIGSAQVQVPEAGGSYDVTADGTALKTITVDAFTGCRLSIAGDPTATPAVCRAGVQQNGSITVDAKAGLVYTVTNDATHASFTPAQATTEVAPGDYTVTVSAAPGYVLSSQNPASWPYHLTVAAPTGCGVTPIAPTAQLQVTCSTDGSYTLPQDANVQWTVASNGTTKTDVAPGTYPAGAQFFDATVVVTAVPITGVQFAPSTTATWTFAFTAPVSCGLPTDALLAPFFTSTPAVCQADGSSQGTITVGADGTFAFLDYAIDGTPVTTSSPVAVAAGTHHVTATAKNPSDSVDLTAPTTVVIAAAGTLCTAELKTLALTGSNPFTLVATALALVLLGLALAAIQLRRRRGGRHLV